MSYFNRNRWWAIAFILLVGMNVATLVTVWLLKEKRPPENAVQNRGVVDFLVKELGFDSLQKEKLVTLREAHHQQIAEIQGRSKLAKDSLFALLKMGDPPDSVVDKAAYASSYFDKQLDLITFHHLQKVRELCTAEQQRKFDLVIRRVLRSMNPMPPPPNGRRPAGPPGDEEEREPPPPRP